MPPEKVCTPGRLMPLPLREVRLPEFAMPPAKVFTVVSTPMPTLPPVMVPLLLTPPPNVAAPMKMPVASAINVPALRTPPENDTALSATRIAASPDAEIVPALLMPPVKVEPDTTMPDVPDVILLAASTVMPWAEPAGCRCR